MVEATAVVETPELRAAVAAGDREAFGELYRANGDRVFRFLMHRCGNLALAEDLAQATWLRAFQGVHHWRDQGRPFVAWLMTIARNLLADHYKSWPTRSLKPVAEFDDTEAPALVDPVDVAALAVDHADDDRRVELWQEAFASLTAHQRQVLMLRVVEGLSVAETGRKLGLEEGAVKTAAYRARRALETSPVVQSLWADLLGGGGQR